MAKVFKRLILSNVSTSEWDGVGLILGLVKKKWSFSTETEKKGELEERQYLPFEIDRLHEGKSKRKSVFLIFLA